MGSSKRKWQEARTKTSTYEKEIRNLSPGKSYTFEVFARNLAGDGPHTQKTLSKLTLEPAALPKSMAGLKTLRNGLPTNKI